MATVSDSKTLTRCPLCEGENQCAVAALQQSGEQQTREQLAAVNCWCMQASIPAEKLHAIAADERGKRCICPNCAAVK